MTNISQVTYKEVRSRFLADNVTTPERNAWPLGALEAANQQFGTWTHVVLKPADVLTVLLPHHDHGVNLVPASGATVSVAIARIDQLDQTTECFKRIQQFLGTETPIIFLSAGPISHPGYPDYHGLLGRGCTGLTHLDGLHRLIAWGWENKRDIPAYVAGLI